ncbi:hypothetical protein D3C71_2111090 [compost metagenome]
MAGVLNFDVVDIMRQRYPCGFLEDAAQIILGNKKPAGNFFNAGDFVVMLVDVRQNRRKFSMG